MGIDALAWPTGEELIEEIAGRRLSRRISPTHYAVDLGQIRSTSVEPVEPRERPLQRLEGSRPTSRSPPRLVAGDDSFGRDYARIFGLEIDPDKASVDRGADSERPHRRGSFGTTDNPAHRSRDDVALIS